MKKTTLIAALLLLFAAGLNAQDFDSIMQPTHVVGLSYDSQGQTVSYSGDFEYQEDGKFRRFYFDIPNYGQYSGDRSIIYEYSNNFLRIKRHYQHRPGYEGFQRQENFSYNSQGRLVFFENFSYYDDQISTNEFNGIYYRYAYDQFNRVVRKEKGETKGGYEIEYDTYWVLEYGNRGKTVITTEYDREYHNHQWNSYINNVSTRLYSDDYSNNSVQVDTYNRDGEITQSTLQSYTYNDQHQLESVTAQLLSDGEWLNRSLTLYDYDDAGRNVETIAKTWSNESNDWVNATINTKSYNDEGMITEDFSGTWSAELQDWVPVKKTVFEYENENSLYIVSFWKYNQDHWARDVYRSQTVLFGKDLEKQQDCVESMTYKYLSCYCPTIDYYQFEFTMERMKRPTYMDVEEDKASSCAVYPNPGKDFVTVKAPVLNAVVRFYDLQGRLLHAQPFDFQTDVNAASWAPGLYLWEIWNGPNKEAAGKWVKE